MFFFLLHMLLGFSNAVNPPLVGKWQGIDKYLIQKGDTLDLTFDGKGYFNNSILVFNKNGTGIDLYNGTEFEYCLDNEMLIIGHRSYCLYEITDIELILVENMSNDLAFWSRYRKIEYDNRNF